MSKFRKNNTKKALLFTLAFAVIIAGALAVTLLTDWNPLGNLVGPTQEDPGKIEPETHSQITWWMWNRTIRSRSYR